MTKQESLNILNSVYEKINSMTENELFDHLMNNSVSFRKDIEDSKKTVKLTEQELFKNYKNFTFENGAIFGEIFHYSEKNGLTGSDIWQMAA